VANAAHAAGLGLGWLIGQSERHRRWRWSLLAAAGAITAVLAIGTLVIRPDPWRYFQTMHPELFQGSLTTPVPPEWRALDPADLSDPDADP
jgi:hypothetical protein